MDRDAAVISERDVIGIIGGMGSYACSGLFHNVLHACGIRCDQDYIEVFVHNNTRILDRTECILKKDDSPVKELIRSLKILEGAGANKIIIGCVTAHYYIDKIKKYCVNSQIINVVEETESYIEKNYGSLKKIGIICSRGAQKVGIWDKYLSEKNITPIYLSDLNQEMIFEDIIYGERGVKSGIFTENKPKLDYAIKCLKKAGADIVLGSCSELQMIQRSILEIGYLDVFDITINKIVNEYYNDL